MEPIFIPHELKSIEVDVEKKIFRINGEDFGENCTGFSIHCKKHDDFSVRAEFDTTVVFATYGKRGEKTGEEKYQTNSPWFSAKGCKESDKDGK